VRFFVRRFTRRNIINRYVSGKTGLGDLEPARLDTA
jgi:hypothetical protein